MGKAYSSCYHHKKKKIKHGQRQETDHISLPTHGFQNYEDIETERRNAGKQHTEDFQGLFKAMKYTLFNRA